MAITINCACAESIEPEEYIEWVDRNIDANDPSSIQESAPKLLALANNKHLLIDTIRAPLQRMASGLQLDNPYTDATFMLSHVLGSTYKQRFAVRANIWTAPKLRGNSMDYETKLYAYENAHDHNFDFLTVGYFGPGYTTKVYEYDSSKVDGILNEHVDIRFLEETTLPPGKIMFYRHGLDIHTQIPPTALSVSLNLLVMNRELQAYSQQYQFDIDRQCISAYVYGYTMNRVSLMEFAGDIGDDNTAELLERIARICPCPRTRAAAYRSLSMLVPSEIERIHSMMCNDASALVREYGV